MSQPKWVKQFVEQEFSSGPRMGEDGKQWCRDSKTWLWKFLQELGVKRADFKFSKGHYEWFAFAKIAGQWWYFSSGDVRYKIGKSLLVRRADGPEDYRGYINQYVDYTDPKFRLSLKQLLAWR